MIETCNHLYSRSINEPRPRLCIECGEPEECRACLGEGDIHMCGKPPVPTLEERVVEFLEGNGIEDKIVYTRNKMHCNLNVTLSEILGDFHGFMKTRNVKDNE